jgi:hypothetical protein
MSAQPSACSRDPSGRATLRVPWLNLAPHALLTVQDRCTCIRLRLLKQQAFGIFQSLHIALCSEQLGLNLPPPGARKSHAEHMFCPWRVCGCLVWLKLERSVRASPTFGPACSVKAVSTTILSRANEFKESDPTQFVWLFSPWGNLTSNHPHCTRKLPRFPKCC